MGFPVQEVYIRNCDGTRYVRAVIFTLTKEESILVESMIASLER